MANIEWWRQWDPENVTVSANYVPESWKTCVIQGVYFGKAEGGGSLGGRISSVFVIFITSLIVTVFPVIARRVRWLRIPKIVYDVAKNFGTGVILTTAFIHLMDPAYSAIGGNSCVGSTGKWADYSWCPAIMLATAVLIFVVDVYCDFYADKFFSGHDHSHGQAEDLILDQKGSENLDSHHSISVEIYEDGIRSEDLEKNSTKRPAMEHVNCLNSRFKTVSENDSAELFQHDSPGSGTISISESETEKEFAAQIIGFLILEFGVIFHSAMIGLTLGSSEHYSTLYIVLVFHQAFEGLGIGARLSLIPFPKRWSWTQYALCIAYSLTTPITIAIGIGIRSSYNDQGYTAQLVSGVLDAMSTGIMLYTAMVELLARDFIFNERKSKNIWSLNLQLFCFLWGAGLMALLGKWA